MVCRTPMHSLQPVGGTGCHGARSLGPVRRILGYAKPQLRRETAKAPRPRGLGGATGPGPPGARGGGGGGRQARSRAPKPPRRLLIFCFLPPFGLQRQLLQPQTRGRRRHRAAKLIALDLSCITPFSCLYSQPRAESLPRTYFCKARINSREAPLNANESPSCSAPPNPHPNFSPRAQTPPAAIDVKHASASPAQPDSTWGKKAILKGQ